MIEMSCTLFKATNSNQTSSSGFPAQLPCGTPESVASMIVPEANRSQEVSSFTRVTMALTQLSFTGGHANSCIGPLFIIQLGSSSLATVMMISVKNG